jgi:hypothetical protein
MGKLPLRGALSDEIARIKNGADVREHQTCWRPNPSG